MVREWAAANLRERLVENYYPGRGIVIGRGPDGEWIQVYWIMGRSDHSRNRFFVGDGDLLRTEAADPSKVEDPSLIIYNAMRVCGRRYIVSNGVQTDDIYDGFAAGRGFAESLAGWLHEPDAPNYTPRISGYADLAAAEAWLSILVASPFDPERSERHFFRFDCIEPGYGYAITTYAGDGDPLPSFAGTPYLLSLDDPAGLWDALDAENKISFAVRRIAGDGGFETQIINRYEAV
ncbi:MAG: IMP cyclohydrolase [Candidatus Latescibacterota bacterium]|nr:IMP cyclohydrolase [Candidatus Latescibacterota bacterium]